MNSSSSSSFSSPGWGERVGPKNKLFDALLQLLLEGLRSGLGGWVEIWILPDTFLSSIEGKGDKQRSTPSYERDERDERERER